MSNSVYLQRIDISNFRVYGKGFSLDLAPEPSVVILAGQNGFGKTTFFDAIEWCLTSKVRRFSNLISPKDIDPLTRTGVEPGRHFVGLSFSSGSYIERSGRHEADNQAVINALRSPDWPDISSVEKYLSMTHFLGQSSAERFSLKDPKDQWESLKGPAGIDEINYVSDRLSGQGAKLAIARILTDAEQSLNDALAEQQKWNDLIRRANDLKKTAGKSSLQSESDALGALLDLLAASRSQPRNNLTEDLSLTAISELLEQELQAASDHCSTRRKTIEQWSFTIGLDESERSRLGEIDKDIVAIAERRSQLQSQTESLTTNIDARVGIAKALDERIGELRQKITHIDRFSAAFSGYQEREAPGYALEEALKESEKSLADLLGDKERLTRSLDGVVTLQDKLHTIRSEISHWEKCLIVVNELTSCRNLFVTELADGDPTLKVSALEGAISFIADEIVVSNNALIDFRKAAEKQKDKVEAISAAIRIVSEHVDTHTTECPVCSSPFQEGGLLLRLEEALQLLQNGDDREFASMRELEASIGRFRTKRDELERQLQIERERTRRYSELTKRISVLESTLAEFHLNSDATEAQVQKTIGQLKAEEAATAVNLNQSGLQAYKDQLAEIDSRITESRARIFEGRSNLERIQLERRQYLDVLQEPSYAQYWSVDKGLLADVSSLRQEILANHNEEQRVRTALEIELKSLNEAKRQNDLTQKELAARAESLSRERSVIAESIRRRQEEWTKLGLTDTPKIEAQLSELSRLDLELERLFQYQSKRVQILDAFRAWANDREYSSLEMAIQDIISGANARGRGEITANLSKKVAEARKHKRACQAIDKELRRVSRELRAKADAYALDILKPLSDRIADFSRVLLSRRDGSIFYWSESRQNRSYLKSAVVRNGEAVDLDPNWYFSEGQLSALSVSTLMAAATSFRWSKWPALLMDDPLQHNDILHATAFADTITGFVKDLGYQVFISTHDADEAAYLSRKWKASKITVQNVALVPHREAGTQGRNVA